MVLVVAGIAAGGALYLLNSRDGLTRAIQWSAALLPGKLSVAQVEGRLRGPLRLQGLSYRDAQREVHLDELALAWQPGELLDGVLHIRDLTLRGLQVVQHGASRGGYNGIPHPPITVVVEHLEATGLSYQSGDHSPQRIDRVTLNGRFEQGVLTIETLAAQAPWGKLDAHGSVQTQGRARIELDTAWRFTLPGQPTLRGSGKIQGNARRVTTTQILQAPVSLTLEAAVDDPYSQAPGWSLHTAAKQLDLSLWRASLTSPLRDVALTLQGTGSAFHGEASLDYPLPQTGTVRVKTQLSGSPQALQFSNLELVPEGSDTRLHLDANVDLVADQPSARITGRWKQLQWPLQGAARIASAEGSFRFEGRPEAYRIALKAPLQLPAAPLGTWEIGASGDRDGLKLETIAAQFAKGGVTGSGEVNWRDGVNWQTVLQLTNIDPATFRAAWPGQIDAQLNAQGTLGDAGPTTHIEIGDLHGSLRGYPVSASAQLTVTRDGVRVQRGELRSGSAHLALDGRIGDSLDLTFDIDAPALQELLPVSGGRAQAKGRLRGTAAAPRLDASADLTALAWDKLTLRRAQGEISANLAPGGAVKASLRASSLTYDGRSLDQAQLSAEGRTEAHTLRLRARGNGGELALTLHGGYTRSRWQGELRAGRWTQPATGAWSLAQPAALTVGTDAVTLARHCWRQTPPADKAAATPGALCLEAQWAASGGWGIDGSLDRLPLALFDPWLPGGAMATGPLDGRFQFRQSADGSETGKAELRLGPGLIHPGQAAVEARALAHQGGTLNLRLAAGHLTGDLALRLEKGGTLAGNVALRPFALRRPAASDTTLSGNLRLQLPNLDLVAALLPRLGIGPGSAEAQLTLSGTIESPRLQGTVALQSQQVEVGSAGITLKALSLRGTSDDGRRWRLSGSTTSGGGKLTVEGSAELDPARGWPTRLRVRGERFEAVNLRDYWALVSPDLTLNLEQSRFTVTGELTVPEAQIRPRRGGSGAQAESRDTVIVGQATPAATSPLETFYAHITLILGDKVEFSGFGLRSRITGQLSIDDTPDSVVKGNGELRVVEGKYKSYGQNLEIKTGRLIFAGGPVDNPGIEARAVRTSGDVTAGILLRGTLRDPQVTLFSTPTLPQADILSYLVLGVPINQADRQSGGSSLLASAAALGYVADSPLVRQIRRGLGIEDLRIESDTTNETVAVTLGRYLSPRLYVSYSVGLSQNDSEFRIRYKVGKNWTLETESGTQSGADLRYVIEK